MPRGATWGSQGTVRRQRGPRAHPFMRVVCGVLWGFQAQVGLVKPKELGFGELYEGILCKGHIREWHWEAGEIVDHNDC